LAPLFSKHSKSTHIVNNNDFRKSLKQVLGFRPGNLSIYEAAFIHRSATLTLSSGDRINNERLEYLGDAILDAVLSDWLFRQYPEADEGALTKIRARLVNRDQLNTLAISVGIKDLLISHINKNHTTRHLYGDALEALIGSVFIDRGYNRTRRFILSKLYSTRLDQNKLLDTDYDYKSQVFQWTQKLNKQISFDYSETAQKRTGNPVYNTILRIDHEIFGEGSGLSKKEAEQNAAYRAWKKIRKIGFID